jgi:hypothetical protein
MLLISWEVSVRRVDSSVSTWARIRREAAGTTLITQFHRRDKRQEMPGNPNKTLTEERSGMGSVPCKIRPVEGECYDFGSGRTSLWLLLCRRFEKP